MSPRRRHGNENEEPGQKKPSAAANILWLLRLCFSLDPLRVILQFLERAANNAIWVFFTVVFLRRLLESLEAGRELGGVLAWIWASIGAVGLFSLGISWFYARYRPLSDNRMIGALSRRLFSQAALLDLERYEDSAHYDGLSLAIREVETRVQWFLEHLVQATTTSAAALFTMAALARMDPAIILFLAFPLVGTFAFGPWINRLQFKRDKESEPHLRRSGYVNRVLFLADYAKELRLSRVMNLLNEHLEAGYRGLFSVIDRYRGRAVLARFLSSSFIFLFAFQGAFLYGAWLAIERKSIGVGTFSVLASSAVAASWMLIRAMEAFMGLQKAGTYISTLRSFLEARPRIVEAPGAPPAPRPLEGISIRGLSFRYRGSEASALDGIDLDIRRGERIAVVGQNGAGKTSLVKLLMRLYEPSSGSILYNGRDIAEYSLSSWRGLFGAAFQDGKPFSLSVAENVLLRAAEGEADYARVRRALELAGVLDRVMALPKGMDTVLTREFDEEGALLSGGEFQKIVIARAFAADFEIAVLDEPSSALDPVSEYRLYGSILEACAGKTLIFISHRLSSATLADRVVVLEAGRIAETGSHAELMAAGGAYARLFRMQAERYLEDEYATMAGGEA